MIITEQVDYLTHTYSDIGYTIIQNGTEIEFIDAWDPIDSGRTYRESENLIVDSLHNNEAQIMTDKDKALIQAAKIMLGISDNESGDE